MKNIIVFILLIFVTSCWATATHQMGGDASSKVFNGIKAELLNLIPYMKNQKIADALKEDLSQSSSSKMKLKSIDVQSVNQIFDYFGLKNPNCDADKNGIVEEKELTCLNKLWKFYLPR